MPLLALALAATLLVAAAPASAVSGNFCSQKTLTSGASCHSTVYHTFFDDIGGYSNFNHATCVGVDISPSGGNLVNVCSSGGEDCFSLCDGYNGYAYVHNHSTVTDVYQGYLIAAG